MIRQSEAPSAQLPTACGSTYRESPPLVRDFGPSPERCGPAIYSLDEVILVFCAIAFIDEPARHSRQKPIERHWLIQAAALTFAVSFTIHHSSHLKPPPAAPQWRIGSCSLPER